MPIPTEPDKLDQWLATEITQLLAKKDSHDLRELSVKALQDFGLELIDKEAELINNENVSRHHKGAILMNIIGNLISNIVGQKLETAFREEAQQQQATMARSQLKRQQATMARSEPKESIITMARSQPKQPIVTMPRSQPEQPLSTIVLHIWPWRPRVTNADFQSIEEQIKIADSKFNEREYCVAYRHYNSALRLCESDQLGLNYKQPILHRMIECNYHFAQQVQQRKPSSMESLNNALDNLSSSRQDARDNQWDSWTSKIDELIKVIKNKRQEVAQRSHPGKENRPAYPHQFAYSTTHTTTHATKGNQELPQRSTMDPCSAAYNPLQLHAPAVHVQRFQGKDSHGKPAHSSQTDSYSDTQNECNTVNCLGMMG